MLESKINPLKGGSQLPEFPIIDVPFHNTRRHYRSIAQLKDTGVWKYDPEPQAKVAGLSNRAANYNVINGEGIDPANVANRSPMLKKLPEFIRDRYEVPFH